MKKLLCSPEKLEELFCLLQQAGYQLLGPTVRNDVIVYDHIGSCQDLPVGWMDEQAPGVYRLKQRADNAYFGYNLGPHSWKQFLFPPREKLFSAKKQESGLVVLQEAAPELAKMAFIGVRACEIQAMLVQDRVFTHYSQYKKRREALFIVAAECTRSVSTCFCTSMECGPEVTCGYDIALTEVINEKEHYFVLRVGSIKAEAIVDALKLPVAPDEACKKAEAKVTENRNSMVRSVENGTVHAMLEKSWGAKRWEHVAKRCINCANCTLVCPTCFCADVQDEVSLDGTHTDRWQSWDSCFNLSHSAMHGGVVRESGLSRYRQWLTHKFGTWWDQFGVSGCVGCGRCITWCPVGIDVREELTELAKEVT